MRALIEKFLRNRGFQIKRYPADDQLRRLKLMKHYKINKVLDVGASDGEYALDMRQCKYNEKIISFEPLNDMFEIIKKASSTDKNWIVNNYALGNTDTKSTINVAGNSTSSSILNMMPIHVESEPTSKYIATQEIEIKQLDTIFNDFYEPGDRIMLKLDTQGYEKNVLDGAQESLKRIWILQLEMSLVQLYENELLFMDMIAYLNNIGFELTLIENGFSDPVTGKQLQVDGIFVNRKLIDSTTP